MKTIRVMIFIKKQKSEITANQNNIQKNTRNNSCSKNNNKSENNITNSNNNHN